MPSPNPTLHTPSARTDATPRPPANPAHFEALALPHLPALRRLALRLTRTPEAADDLVQDAMVRAYSRWHQFDEATNCRAWLMRITTTTFINHYRRRVKERQILADEQNTCLGDRFFCRDATRRWSEPETAWLDRHLSPTVLRALATLRPEFRAVVEMSDILEMPYRDVAEALDIPVGTVMSRLFRARQALKRELAEHAQAYGIGTSLAA
jgi:RNA polymerase sigma-70 factor (ECF subfamily)